MATKLYDRCEAGDSMLTDAGAAILRSFQFTVKDFLENEEEYAPVDLRDLQSVLNAAVDDVILTEIINRRLSAPRPLRGERGTQGADVCGEPACELCRGRRESQGIK